MNLHDPDYREGHSPPVLTAAQIYDDLRPRLLAWPAPVAQVQPDEAEPHDMWTVIVGAVIVAILIWACIEFFGG